MPGKEVQGYEWGKNMIVTLVNFMRHGTTKKDEFRVAVKPKTTIAEYKKHIQASCSITGQGTLSLTQDGKELDGQKFLEDYGITENTEVYLRSYTPRRMTTSKIRVKVAGTEEVFLVSPQAHFCDLPHMVQDRCKMPVEEQIWYKGGKVLKMSKHRNTFAVTMDQRSRECLLRVKWSKKTKRPTTATIG